MATSDRIPTTDLSRGDVPKMGPKAPSLAPRAATPKAAPAPPRLTSVVERLFQEGYAFDFFQAVRLLERVQPSRTPVGRRGPVAAEVARFSALASLTFPPSSI